jgi:uncharacterized protein YjiS (DUF1127 family)
MTDVLAGYLAAAGAGLSRRDHGRRLEEIWGGWRFAPAEKEDRTMKHMRGSDFGPADAGGAGLAARARRAAQDWLRRVRAAREARSAGARLAALDDHLLCDIGISRADAWRLSRGDF